MADGEKMTESIFVSSDTGIFTACQWTLVKIVGFFGQKHGATVREIWDCVHRFSGFIREEIGPFIFWLGPGITVEKALDRMSNLDILICHHSVKRYTLSSKGEQALKEKIPEIVRILNFRDDEEFNDILSKCINCVE